MKHLRLFLAGLFIFASAAGLLSQTGAKTTVPEKKDAWSCASQSVFDADQLARQVYEQQFSKFMNAGEQASGQKVQATMKRIPVVVHVLYDAANASNPAVNISYNQIQWQIAALNTAFQKNYPSYTNNQMGNGPYAVDTKIQFCLARIPMGTNGFAPNEPGVVRYQVPGNILIHTLNVAGQNQLLNVTHANPANFPFDKYLNIWLVSSIVDPATMVPTAIGYANFPGGGTPLDGIVMERDVIGDNTVPYTGSLLIPQLDKGRILAHETGHYLGLLHTFTGGCAGDLGINCASAGDLICDTPPTNVGNPGVCSGVNSCFDYLPAFGLVNQPDMLENFMSYADDDCMNTFTNMQSTVMNGVLNTSWPTGRLDMTTPSNLTATGLNNGVTCCPTGVLSAGFSYVTSCLSFSFTNLMPSCNINSTYSWDFGDGNTSASINPVHLYASAGPFVASCTVTAVNGTTASYSLNVSALPTSTILQQSGNQLVCNNSEQSIYVAFGANVASVQLTDGTNTVTLNNLCPACAPNIGIYTFTVTNNVTYSLLPGYCGNYNTASFTVTDCCPNMVTNGDFESGNTGISSELLFNGAVFGSYFLKDPTANTFTLDYEFDGLAAYTGTAMLCDGFSGNNGIVNIANGMGTSQKGKIWEQTMTGLLPNTTYYVSYKTTRNIFSGVIYYGGNLEYRMRVYNTAATSTLFTSPVISQPLNSNNSGFNFTVFNYTFQTGPTVSPNYSFSIFQESNFAGGYYDYMIDNILFQPFSNINLTTASGTSSVCIGDQIQLQASGAVTYTWMPGGLNTAAISVTPAITTIYTVTGNAGGCLASEQITVTPYLCCTTSPTNIFAYNNYTFTSNAVLTGPYAFFTGNSAIDPGVNVNISNAEIVMSPNAKITLKASAGFTVGTSWIHSCTDMWDGIYLYNKSQIHISGSFIEDAKRAIVDTLGASKIRSGDNIFNKNRIGVHLKYPVTTNNIQFDYTIFTTSNLNIGYPIAASYFTYFTGNGMNISAVPAQLLKAPYTTIYGQYGIVMDTTSWNGGAKIELYSIRTDKLYQGILSRLSKAHISTSTFQNHTGALHPVGEPSGIFILGSNAGAFQAASNVSVGGASTSETCYFVNNRFGILNRNSSVVDVSKNEFDDHFIGIVITTNSSNKLVKLYQNKIRKTQFGIDFYDNLWIDGRAIENRMDNGTAPIGNATSNMAIMALEVTPPAVNPANYANYFLDNNYINGYYAGINVGNTYATLVRENEIHLVPDNMPANIQRGILFDGTGKIAVKNNIVDKPSPDNKALWQIGIAGNNNLEPVVSCNSILNMATSIKMQGPNYTPVAGNGIVLNKMQNAYYGFWLDGAGNIGNQFISGSFNSDNQWNTIGFAHTYVSGLSNSALARFYTQGGAPFFVNISANGNTGPVYAPLSSQLGFPNSGQSCGAPIPTPQKGEAPKSALAMYFAANENPNLSSTLKRMLLRDIKAGDSNTEIEGNAFLKAVKAEGNTSLENKLYQVDSLIQLARFSGNEKFLSDARAMNNSILPTCTAEENQKWLNEIYMASQLTPLNEQQISLLEELAIKCPENDGLAVYQARNILLGVTNHLYNSTCEQASSISQSTGVLKQNANAAEVKLYPNPATKEITVEYVKQAEDQTAVITFFNSFGEVVSNHKLPESKTTLSVANLLPGVYVYKVSLSDGTTKTNKLIISK